MNYRSDSDLGQQAKTFLSSFLHYLRTRSPEHWLFFAIGVIPKAHFLADVLQLNEEGYIVTDDECRTSLPGVFAAGDVRSKILKQIATAVGDGAVAAIAVEKYLEGF